MKQKIKKLNKQFWDAKLNPITMWKSVRYSKAKDHSVKAEIKKKDQASIFKPKGFR